MNPRQFSSIFTTFLSLFAAVVALSLGQAAGAAETGSLLVPSRASIESASVTGVRNQPEIVQLSAASPQSWSVAADVPWITFAASSGTTPAEMKAVLSAANLAAGTYAGNITVTSGGGALIIPVSFRVYAANFVMAKADLELPYVYLVSQASTDSTLPSFLVRVHTGTHQLDSAVACGTGVTDMAVHYQDNRVYLTNWKTGVLRAFDRTTFAQVQTYQFAPVGPVGYGEGGIWRVSAGKRGRVILEESDQWIDIRLIDTANGAVLATTSGVYVGDGDADPTGRTYYHSESSMNEVTRFDLAADTFVAMTPVAAASSGTVVVIPDGSKVAVGAKVFDATLGVQYTLPAAVVAGTLHGDLLFTSSKAYSGSSGLELASLPITSTLMAVTGDQRTLYQFSANSKAFTVVNLATIAALPSRALTPTLADGATVIGTAQQLGWNIEPFATSYQVYFGSDRATVANATVASPEYLGSTQATTWTGALPSLALDGNYFWRVDVIGYSGVSKGAVWAFSIAPLSITPGKLDLTLPVSAPVESRTLTLTGPVSTGWSASTTTSWLSLPTTGGTTPGSLEVRINPAGLAVGIYQGSVRFQSGSDSWSLPVSLELLTLNYTLAKADLDAPYVYAISQAASGTDDRAFMVVIDTRTNAISRVLPVGRSVTDFAIHYPENRIYLTNWKSGVLRALDRTSLSEVQTYQFAQAGVVGYATGDAFVVAAGRSGRIMVEDYDQWIDVKLYDTASGVSLASGGYRQGGGVFEPTGRYYFHGEDNSSGAALQKLDTNGDKVAAVASKRVATYSYYGSRRVAICGDGSRVFWNGGVFDQNLNVVMQMSEEVVAATYHGEVLFTNTKAVNGSNSQSLATLPVDTKVQAVSADQKKLFLFKAGAVTVVDLSAIASLPPRGLVPGIPDGSAIIDASHELSWSLEAAALSYDVYFGSSAAAVAAATKSSAEYLGNVTGTKWTGTLPTLARGSTYYWRVDVIGFSATNKGGTWSFGVASVDVTPRTVQLAAPTGSPVVRQSLAMTADIPTGWTASTTTPWITLRATSGSTPNTLQFDVSTTGLTIGNKSGSITLQAAGKTFTVPVELSIVTLNITKLVAHPNRPVVYALNTSLAGEGFCHLLEIDPATAAIQRTLPIGYAPTDADLDPVNDRLYITNWGYSQTRVIDVAAWTELPPLNLGEDIYNLEVTPTGKLVTEGEDQWVALKLWDAATGANLATATTVREGDGQADPTGGFYYHCDNNSSGAILSKYNIAGNSFVQSVAGPQIGYGSRNLVMSGDGKRLFWLGRTFDENLTTLATMPSSAEVYATNRTGELAVGASAVWWSDSGTQLATLPFAGTVAAVSANDAWLVRFNATTRALQSTAIATLTDLPGPWPRPGQILNESPQRLSWSPLVELATGYRVFIAADAASLLAMITPTATVTGAYYDLPAPLAFGRNFSWRVDTMIGTAVATGKVQSFTVRFPQGPALALSGFASGAKAAGFADRSLLLGINEYSSGAQLYDFDPVTGGTHATQSFSIPGSYSDHYFGNSAALDSGKAVVGAYGFDTPASGCGAAYLYRPGTTGYWGTSGPLVPPTPVASEGFGLGLAAGGNLMLAGTSNSYSSIGRVVAYLTEPAAMQTQVFSAADGASGDAFGKVIVMDGNRAVIAAPGAGSSYSRIPCLYAFNRSTATGLWSQSQKIAIPGATASSVAGSALALSGGLLATRVSSTGVAIFTESGTNQWTYSVTISNTSVTGASSSFGTGLALQGDLLLVGDPGASYLGTSGGAVFTFRRKGSSWVAGPVLTPSASRSGFGQALAARDGWLLVAGATGERPASLFRTDGTANATPRFVAGIPTQVVVGRAFSIPLQATDDNGNAGLVITKLQGPAWLALTDNGNGQAVLSGTPGGTAGSVQDVQLRVRDAAGAQALWTYRLTVLATTDVPALTQEPVAADLGVGQELLLRAAVSGIGPFQWQWYRNGEPISGATRDTLAISEVALADGGSYYVRVTNVVGGDDSAAVGVTVHPANRLGGDWLTFGSSPAHTGRHPAALDSCKFLPAWTQTVQSGYALNRAAIANGRAVVVPQGYFVSGLAAKSLDLATGAPLWSFAFPSSYSSNPPSVFNGRVYFQRGKGTGDVPQLFCLNAATGAQVWASTYSAQWEAYEAPAVTDQGIFVNGGSYGGIYGFNLDGSQRFFQTLPQDSGWTPTLSKGRLFSWVSGSLIEHNPADGTALWSLATPSATGVAAIAGDAALLLGSGVSCVDLATRSLRWQVTGSFSGRPAIAVGRAFAIQGNAVRSYNLTDGAPGIIYQADATLSGQPILFNDRLVISGGAKTWVFDLTDGKLLQTLGAGGPLSYSNGYLLAAGSDGVMRAFLATPQPRIAVEQPAGAPLAAGVQVVDCGTPPVGATTTVEFTIRNTGLVNLTGLVAAIAGTNATDFAITAAPVATLVPGGVTSVTLAVSPSVPGPRSATLRLSSNDPERPLVEVSLVVTPPVLALQAATAITGTRATLHGTVQPNHHGFAMSFEYGGDTGYGMTASADLPLVIGGDMQAATAAIDGLRPGTIYHYRMGATNLDGTHWSEDMTFTTLSDNALLAGLTLDGGGISPTFEKQASAYLMSVPFGIAAVAVHVTTDHPRATFTVNGGAASAPVDLAVGNNPLAVEVTAEDGITTKSYTLVVTRMPLELVFNSRSDVPLAGDGFAAGGNPASLVLGFAPTPGTVLTLVNNTGLGFIYGRFGNLAQGQRVSLTFEGKIYDFIANYHGGTGNDLVLQWANTQLLAWGGNGSGQLGDGSTEHRLIPTPVNTAGVLADQSVLAMAGGYLHSVALCADGTLAAWGYNLHGQLGNDSQAASPVPVAVEQTGALAGKSVVAISAGPFHNLALCEDGTIVAWGYNNHGQLGDGSRETRRAPVLVPRVGALATMQVVAVAAGAYQSFALGADGTVAAWGYNDEGELGDGSTTGSLVPVAVDRSGALAGKRVASLAAGQYHTLALCTDGTLVSWGYNKSGQLGNDTTTAASSPVAIGGQGALAGRTPVAISAGGSHSLAWCADGTLAAWGANKIGQLGRAGESSGRVPVPVDLAGLSGIAGLAVGGNHSLLRLADDRLIAWGENTSGQLGDGSLLSRAIPLEVTGLTGHVMAMASGVAAQHNLALQALPMAPAGTLGATAVGLSEADLIARAFPFDPARPGSARLPEARLVAGEVVIRFTQPATVTDILYGAEWSATLQPGSWQEVADTGSGGEHRFAIPAAGASQGFIRLKVTAKAR